MDVQPLVDTYQRYKAGTEKLIKWLVNSAKPANAQSVAAKKLSRKAGSTSSAQVVIVDELVRLAVQIVSADPKIDIPIDILNATYDVITGRSWSCDWYSALTKNDIAHQTEEVKQSNSRQRYFLDILKKENQLLSKEAKARRPKRKKKLEFATDSNNLNNLYLHLELEDSAIVDDSSSPDTQIAKSASKVKPAAQDIKIQGIEENGEEEELFALYCHLQDLFELRLQHRKVWQDYLTGDLSFMTACQVFDQAVAFADMLATRFAAAHPNLHSFDATV